MAYLPGLDHDLFLSYAHDDARWVKRFQTALLEALRVRLPGCEIWQDVNKIRTGQDWP